MCNQPAEFRIKIALFLLIFLTGIHCMAQNNQVTIHSRNLSSRSTLISSERMKNEGPVQARSIVTMKEKMQSIGLHPKQKTETQLIDSVYMWRWDSTSADWALDYKYSVLEYDANNNSISELGENWDGSAWIYSDQVLYTYDDKNNLTEEVWQYWNGTGWDNDQKSIYTYDALNNLLTESVAYWDGDAWANSMKIINTYDANSNRTTYLHQNWNDTEWENYWKEIYTYDARNNMIGLTYQKWIENQWVNDGQNTYVFDNDDKLISSVTQYDNAAELVTTETKYFYNAENRLAMDSTRTRGNSWEVNHIGTYTYDSYGNLISWLAQNTDSGNPENTTRTVYTYDAAHNQTSINRQDWKENSWVNLDFDRYSYNENNLVVNYSYKYWNSDGTSVMDGDSLVFFYTGGSTGINVVEGTNEYAWIYPNPNNGKFTLTANATILAIDIFNVSGKLVYSDSGSGRQMQKDIDLSGSDKGVYLVKIQTGKGIEVKKLLIR
jgi:hypothetical protein